MLKSIIKSGVLTLLAATLVIAPAPGNAQTDKPATEAKPNRVTPFHGKLKSLDKDSKIISVGEMKIQITPETKILKDGQPATLEDGVVNEMVGGAYRKSDDGKLNATIVRFGAKPEKAEEARMK